ncbi:Tuberous sclerosis 2-like protein [Metarhizium acridum]|nr:Tuberous sclerosis 2-like protein [Metarhizium acridum]
MMDAYEIVNLVGDGAEQNFIPRMAKSILQNIAEEGDVLVLDAVMSLMVSVVVSCDMELFDFVIDALRAIVVGDRLKSPISPSVLSATISPTMIDAPTPGLRQSQSPSHVVTRGYVRMFLRLMNSHSCKSVKLYNALVGIAKTNHCESDARLTAMKLLFRLRADWANRVFVTDDLDNISLATAMYRTDASFAKKQAEEAAQSLRLSRSDHGNQSRSSRGVSLSQSQHQERGHPVRTPSGAKNITARYHQLWRCPDPQALPEQIPNLISPVLVSHSTATESSDESEDADEAASNVLQQRKPSVLNMTNWLDAVLDILQGSEWEIYSFALVHLPSQLSNHAIFRGAIPQIQELRRIICDQIRMNGFQEPPFASGLRRADVAICLFHSLTMILSYHEHFGKGDEDEIVKTFILGIGTWERTAKYCIHALSICCHELPLSTSKSLVQMLNQMAASITQPNVSVHILEFLACLSRLHNVYVNFREDEYRIVFAICFRYLEYARDKRQLHRGSHNGEPNAGWHVWCCYWRARADWSSLRGASQYVHALAYHVILFWFLALNLQDRATHVSWIVKKLFSDPDSTGQNADEQALTSIDFMQRVTYADVDESCEDPYFTEDRFGPIVKKQWIIGNSIVTVKQATVSGWAQIIKRQPSGTSAYTIRETYAAPTTTPGREPSRREPRRPANQQFYSPQSCTGSTHVTCAPEL